jgi:hypothetical protein
MTEVDTLLDTNVEEGADDNKGGEGSSSSGKPNFLPDDYWDADAGAAKVEDIWNAFQKESERSKGLRQKLSQGSPGKGEVPDSPDGYEFTPSEALAELKIAPGDDGMKLARTAAHKHGISKEAFNGFVNEFLQGVVSSGALPKEMTEEEQKEQFRQTYEEEVGKLGRDGEKIISGISEWGKKQIGDGVFSKEDFESFSRLVYDAGSARIVQKLISLTGTAQLPHAPALNSSGMSKEELDARIADPRYESDKAFRNETDRMFRKFYDGQ